MELQFIEGEAHPNVGIFSDTAICCVSKLQNIVYLSNFEFEYIVVTGATKEMM